MKRTLNYQSTVGAISIFSGVLALACLVVGTMAVENNFDAFSNPVLTLNYSHNYLLAKWFNLLDLFGYYLLLLPLIFYVHEKYKNKSAWVGLFTFSGIAYVIIGAIGASILAALWPEMMKDYLQASEEAKLEISALFKTTTYLVTMGLWNTLEVLFAAVWCLGFGSLWIRENKGLGILTLLLGFSTLLDAIGNMFGIQTMAEIGLNAYLILAIIWPVWIGISLIRTSPKLSVSSVRPSLNSFAS